MGPDSSSSINLAYLKLPRWRTRCRFPTLVLLLTLFLFYLFILFIAFYWAGFTIAQRERAQEDFNVPYEGAPPHPPPICIRKTATAPGSPYSFRIVRGFFYVPQNYQHSRNCETGPPAYRPYPRRLESLTICRWYYKGSTFSSVI